MNKKIAENIPRNSLIELIGFTDQLKSPYLQVFDERNLVGEFNDVLGDSYDILGDLWYDYTVYSVISVAR